MERSMAIAVGIMVAVLVGTLAVGYGYLWLSTDPAAMAQRQCGARPGAPTCSDFVITARMLDRVEFTYKQSDGTHCAGYEEVTRRGPLGLPAGGSGGATCTPLGMPLSGPHTPPPPPTPLPDGNLPCQGRLGFGAAAPTATGFEVPITNASGATCDVSGSAKLIFWDASGRPAGVDVQPSGEAAALVPLAPGASALLDFDLGQGPCQSPPRMLVITSSGASSPIAAPPSICGPLVAHPARPAP